MGQAQRVMAWIDKTPVAPGVCIDAPATIMFQFKQKRAYGVFDIAHTPDIRMDSKYYSDDDRIEIVGEKGILFINRYTAKTIDLPELMLFKDGKTIPVPVKGVEWEDSFIAATRHMLDILQHGGAPRLDGPTGKAVLQFTLAAQLSAREGREINTPPPSATRTAPRISILKTKGCHRSTAFGFLFSSERHQRFVRMYSPP